MPPPYDLIERYLDGELSSEQEPLLEEWLRSDREHLRIFLREVHLSRGMRELRFEPEAEAPTKEGAAEVSEAFGLPILRWAFAQAVQRWGWVATAGALTVLLVAFAWRNFSATDISVSSDGGLVLRREGSEQVVHGTAKLRSGDTIRTETSARAMIQYDGETTRLEVGGGTSLEIHQKQRKKLVRLNVGSLYGTVAPQRFGRSLQFVTPQAQANVFGTDLKLLTRPDQTELEVYSGKVLLARSDGSDGIQVQAGHAGLVTKALSIGPKPIPSAAGSILWEYWLGISGATVVDLTMSPRFAAAPDDKMHCDNFETPHPLADNYGGRVRGYLHPPRTGEYTFWIAGDDAVELWLSRDDLPDAKQRICYTSAFTRLAEWEKYRTQRSKSVHLVGGRRYYMEALLKQAGGNDGLAVAWKGPDLSRQIIAGAYLSPVTERAASTESKP